MVKKNTYEQFIDELVYYFNPLKLEQLELAMSKYFAELPQDVIQSIITGYQQRGYILISSDGWVTTKGKYIELTDDTRYSGVKFENVDARIDDFYRLIKEDSKHLKLVDALWILIDMLPDSMDYTLLHKPFNLAFISKKTHKLYEIMVINSEEEDVRIELLKALPNDYYDEVKNSIRRIVIMENPDHDFKLPHNVGVAFICKMDNTNKKHFVITKNRLKDKEQIW